MRWTRNRRLDSLSEGVFAAWYVRLYEKKGESPFSAYPHPLSIILVRRQIEKQE